MQEARAPALVLIGRVGTLCKIVWTFAGEEYEGGGQEVAMVQAFQPLILLGEPRWLCRGGNGWAGAGPSGQAVTMYVPLQVQRHKEGRRDGEHVLLHLHSVP